MNEKENNGIHAIQISDDAVDYWTLNESLDQDAKWIRAKGLRVLIGEFGEFYIGRRCLPSSDLSGTDGAYGVTHPATGRLVCRSLAESVEKAAGEAADFLRSVGPQKFKAVTAVSDVYTKPTLDPSRCDEIAVPAFLKKPFRGVFR